MVSEVVSTRTAQTDGNDDRSVASTDAYKPCSPKGAAQGAGGAFVHVDDEAGIGDAGVSNGTHGYAASGATPSARAAAALCLAGS